MLPSSNVETQTQAFGKSGISQFAVTFLLSASWFIKNNRLRDIMSEKEAAQMKPDDFVVYFVTLYSDDAKQDWVHTLQCKRAAYSVLVKKFPHIKEVIERSDAAGNFRCAASLLAVPYLSEWTGVRIRSVGFSEAGNGKNHTDSELQKEKHHIREYIKLPGASAQNAAEVVHAVQHGKEACGTQGNAFHAQLYVNRTCEVACVEKGSIKNISKFYHYEYYYGDQGKCTGMRAFAYRGVGTGVYYSREEMDKSWVGKGLEDMKAEFTSSGSDFEPGAKVYKGPERKLLEAENANNRRDTVRARAYLKNEMEKNVNMAAKQELECNGVYLCRSCGKAFMRYRPRDSHEIQCKEEKAAKEENQQNSRLRPVSEIASSAGFKQSCAAGGAGLHSDAPNVQCPSTALDELKQGWAAKPKSKSVGRFSCTVRDFLRQHFQANIKEFETHELMKKVFTGLEVDDVHWKGLVLTLMQIKSWNSTEHARRKKAVADQVIGSAITRAGAVADEAAEEDGV